MKEDEKKSVLSATCSPGGGGGDVVDDAGLDASSLFPLPKFRKG